MRVSADYQIVKFVFPGCLPRVPYLCAPLRLCHSLDRHHGARPSFRGHGLLGFEIGGGHRSHGPGLLGGGRPCEGSIRGVGEMVIEHFGVEECDHDGECQSEVRMDDRGRYRNARMLKEVCAPTRLLLEQFH
jgi:hypothetical protein